MHDMKQVFGLTGEQLAVMDANDPATPAVRSVATTGIHTAPAERAVGALLDPQYSAIFWVGLAAILGLVLVTGQLKVEAALGLRGGKS